MALARARILAAAAVLGLAAQPAPDRILIVADAELGAPGRFGVAELERALRARGAEVDTRSTGGAGAGMELRIGVAGRSTRMHDLVYSGRLQVPPGPEAYARARVEIDGRSVAALAGSDERGLMYGLLELARALRHLPRDRAAGAWLTALQPRAEKPATPVRGMVQFLHSADLERAWYYDRGYWDAYLGMLARDRFNSLNLVFAHQTDYLAPPYPFLVEVEAYPQVRVPGLSAADRGRNLETLKMISTMARERGIDFVLGVWEHQAWKRGQRSMVDGLTDAIAADYSRRALEMVLRACPDIAGVQLRVNTESGIENARQTEFYRAVFEGMRSAGREVFLDLRGWGALPGTIDAAVASKLPMRLSMKYWAEFMGMPYQAAEMLPSYSYADFLAYPRRYPVLYQMWSLGSHRLLPWGGVEWMKRFVPTARLGGALGFETCAPLSQKGFGNPPGAWPIFPDRAREYYAWEFERYWLYYLLYGRLGYDPATPEEVWHDEFRTRFGAAARPLFDAFQSASEVLPFLVSWRLSNPNMYIWPEKQMGGILDFYLEVKPADTARFASFEEYAARRLAGKATAKMMPEEAALRLVRMAEETERQLGRADAAAGANAPKEHAANRIDLTVLALLARYHASKIRAAAQLALFYAAGDESALSAASSAADAGLETWQRLARLTDGVYHPAMVFGPRDRGHWKDNLVFVRHDVDRLAEVSTLLGRYGLFDLGLDFGARVAPRLSPYEPQYGNTYPIERRFRLLAPDSAYSPERGYGWLAPDGITASPPMAIPYASLEGDNLDDLALPRAVLYEDYLRGARASTLRVDLPDGDYRVTAVVANRPELASGAFRIRAGAEGPAIAYAAGETGDKSADVRAAGGRLELEFVPERSGTWLVSGLVIARRAPRIAHVPSPSAAPGVTLQVAATITAPDGVAEASLSYGPAAAAPRVVALRAAGRRFSAEIPIERGWNGGELQYWFEARDRRGTAARLPARGAFAVPVGQDRDAPVVSHVPAPVAAPGTPLRLRFEVRDPSRLAAVRLHYRNLTQTQKFTAVELEGRGGVFEAEIPGAAIVPRYDLQYYLEAVDRFGNGVFYPDPDRQAPYVVVNVKR